jgi:predicted metal-dependent enzyme (double-stranded beta helix superfamily)
MPQSDTPSSIRTCAARMIRTVEAYERDGDSAKLRQGLLDATLPVAQRPDLYKLGVKRQANHIENAKWLYYDDQLTLEIDEFPKGKFIPPHDHGVWEALVLCSGALKHTVYERVDDRSVEGHSELKVIEEVVMKVGDIAMVVPPSDIHSFEAQTEGTFVLTIVGGEYSPLRHYYNLRNNTYAVRTPKALRESGALA